MYVYTVYHQRQFGKIQPPHRHAINIYNYIYRIIFIDHALFNHLTLYTPVSCCIFFSLLDLVCVRSSGEYRKGKQSLSPCHNDILYTQLGIYIPVLFVYWDVYGRMEYKTNLIKVLNRRDDC